MILLRILGTGGKWIARLSITASIVTALSFPALGRESPKTEVKTKEPIPERQEALTVTANKQEENVQEVPMSMSAFNGLAIEDKQIENINELGDFVSNLMIFNDGIGGVNSPSMRGIHADAESLGVSTGLYIDEIPVSNTLGFADPLLDIERVEVLRGPQGTLYGKNTEVGAINIITRLPDNEFRAKASTKIGINAQSAALNLSGPISRDKLFFGLTGRYYEENGFVERVGTNETVDDRENMYGKGQLRWTPSEDLEVRMLISHLQLDDGASRMNRNPGCTLFSAAPPNGFGMPAPGDREVASNRPAWNKSKEDSQALKISYDINDALALTSTSTHRVFNEYRSIDTDFSSMDFLWMEADNTYRTISEELRLSYDAGWKWLIGFYGDMNDYEIRQKFVRNTRSRDEDGHSYALFGQTTVPLTSQLNITGGLRYEYQQLECTDNIADKEFDESWENISPKLALDYRFTPQVMGYASVAKGFRAGGFNYFAGNRNESYDAEEVWSYEAGAKSQLFDNRLILNGAVYYMDIQDMQATEGAPPMDLHITNSAEATAHGVEVDMQLLLTRCLTLDAGFGYSHVEYDKFKDDSGIYDGNKSPYAPEFTVNVGAQYRTEKGLYFRTDVVGYGRMYLDKANKYSRDPYALVNAKIGYETEHLDIYLFTKNLFDTNYDTEGYYGGLFTLYNPPREVGLTLAYRF
ncbi:MAG: TonB-dependent receptor [Desulfobacteraceae bacterium]|nr:TonB-dependent receptor [Desulfobacteraceae bacterium]